MPIEIDEHFLEALARWEPSGEPAPTGLDPERVLAYFDAQVLSRHVDFAARWLQSQGEGFYTIGSSGHESNAAVAMALRPTDPALLHYRSGGFYMARAAQLAGTTPVRDVLLGVVAGVEDPISGGRHKVFGHPGLNIIPQTSTIGSHLPRALGVAFALGRRVPLEAGPPWPEDAVVVTSLGDASANHSTVLGALNAAAYTVHRGMALPLLVVCEDNGIGISTKTPDGWISSHLSRYPQLHYVHADGSSPLEAMRAADAAVDHVRSTRRPCLLHLETVRLMGHAGSDVELGYRTRGEIAADYRRDPLWGTARLLLETGVLSAEEIRGRYEDAREEVAREARALCGASRLSSAAAVMEPLTRSRPDAVRAAARRTTSAGDGPSRLPDQDSATGQTLAQAINSTLADVLELHPEAMVFGEDVARKGGVYGVTRGLARKYGHTRVFDTLLDEQTILGLALGGAISGLLPIPEIQYLAYVHNAEDQLRGEAATLAFFSSGQYRNGMVVRIAGLAYQKGFGGHFHNDNSLAALRDIPGLVLAVPSSAQDAPGLLRTCVALATEEGRVCVYLEPIALYHERDLHRAGDGLWTRHPAQTGAGEVSGDLGEVRTHGDGGDVLLVTFGNGVRMSLRAARRLEEHESVACTVLDLRWLHPLPVTALVQEAARFGHVLVVDETRQSGGVSEGVLSALIDHGYAGAIARVTSQDSIIPLGPAADEVLLCEQDIVDAAVRIMKVQPNDSRNT